MKKALITILIIVAVLALVAFVYFKYIKVNTESSTVNTGETSTETYREYLNSIGVSDEEVNQIAKLTENNEVPENFPVIG